MPSRTHKRTYHKIKSHNALQRIIRQQQHRGRRVVFTNGCFDLLHAGHIVLLERAKQLGDVLIVATNSDRSIRSLKGPSRPIVPQRDRVRLLAALESVDYVTTFNDPTPQQVVAKLRPDVLVKGADWSPHRIAGADVVQRAGGKIVRLPLLKGYSTTQLISRIQRIR